MDNAHNGSKVKWKFAVRDFIVYDNERNISRQWASPLVIVGYQPRDFIEAQYKVYVAHIGIFTNVSKKFVEGGYKKYSPKGK